METNALYINSLKDKLQNSKNNNNKTIPNTNNNHTPYAFEEEVTFEEVMKKKRKTSKDIRRTDTPKEEAMFTFVNED